MSRARAARAAAAASLVLAALTACDHSAKGECKVSVNGAFGSAVTVDVDCPSAPRNVVKDVVVKGKGNAIDKGQTALLRATSFDSRSGKIVSRQGGADAVGGTGRSGMPAMPGAAAPTVKQPVLGDDDSRPTGSADSAAPEQKEEK